ncbi:hypothetical protein [Salinisphaera sp. Q1T1-3]|uniref:hypothetical protein n=1 Tax=Salinisphaera sp. Q1T1-3 TaxID=2321229 RepID=UPI000E715156|nr:hypothetical protein [Salinisphaera sp. Q1T1-3]RJS94875.1 hypothetical protein D3260_03700 [Salinisphaera sp. Q1T1-3]
MQQSPGGIACSADCRARIDNMAALVASATAEQKPPARADYRPVLLMLLLGVTFVGLLTRPYALGLFCLVFGLLSLIYRLIQNWRAKKQHTA